MNETEHFVPNCQFNLRLRYVCTLRIKNVIFAGGIQILMPDRSLCDQWEGEVTVQGGGKN